MNTKFSVLVPVYNVEKYLARCIESVICQNYQDFELILIDDGSPDRCGQICDMYAAKDRRIKVFHDENHGLLYARRFAIERARGDIIIFLDSDDLIKQNALSILAKKFEQYQCDCIIYGYETFNDNEIIKTFKYDDEKILSNRAEILRSCFYRKPINPIWCKAVKREVFHDFDYSNFWGYQLGEDLLQSVEICFNSTSIAFIPDILYCYRVNSSSITHDTSINRFDFTIRKYVLQHLLDEPSFLKEDIDHYRDLCIANFVGAVKGYVTKAKSVAEMKNFFSRIRKDTYYSNFLDIGIKYTKSVILKDRIVFYLFQKELYLLLFMAVNFNKLAKR